MSLYQTTDAQKVQVIRIGAEMADRGLAGAFVAGAVELASESQGIYELMSLWASEEDPEVKDEILSDLQESIDEAAKHGGE